MWIEVVPKLSSEPLFEFICRGLRWRIPGEVDLTSAWMRVCHPSWEDLRGQ